MNRRSFFKTIVGVVAGLFGMSVPGKAKTYTYKEIIGRDISGVLERRSGKIDKGTI